MLTLLGSPRRFCDGITRRETLKAGSLALMGSLFRHPLLNAASEDNVKPTRRGKAKSVIFFFLFGGAATQDMWDLKPNAPVGVRSDFKPVPTRAPGVQICELLPGMAQWMHKAALVRSVNHRAGCHNGLPAYTGCEITLPDNQPRDHYPPSMGSVCEYLRQGRSDLPAYVCLPNYTAWDSGNRFVGQYAGFLGKQYDPLFSECKPFLDPGSRRDHRAYPPLWRGRAVLGDTTLQGELTLDRLEKRRGLLTQLDDRQRQLEQSRAVDAFSRTRGRAFSLLTGSKLKSAFDLGREDPRLLDRYGHTLFGSSALIARKLVEQGVQFVNVTWDSYQRTGNLTVADAAWDTHEYNFEVLRRVNLPVLDQTFNGLMSDLDERGLLDETLVAVVSDFGRTPNINKDAGRDHWTYCYTVLLAGAGIKGGTVYGSSDAHAAAVRDNPVSTSDVCATIYHCLGIDPETQVHDHGGRPLPVANGGQPIRDILA
jgi:hypothetical protein